MEQHQTGTSRRSFLKATGFGALGTVVAGSVVGALGRGLIVPASAATTSLSLAASDGYMTVPGRETDPVYIFGFVLVDRNDRSKPAAFLRVLTVPFVGQEMFECDQQESAKPALRRARRFESPAGHNEMEEALSQIFGVMKSVTFLANKSVHRIPVSGAEFLQCHLGSYRVRVHQLQHHAPLGSSKVVLVIRI